MSNQPNQLPQKETPYILEDMEALTKFHWEILARLRDTAQAEAKEYIALRDGRKCWHCGVESELAILEFHHLDRNNAENHRWNLRLVHHPCNTHIYHTEQKGRSLFSVQRPRERETSGVPSEALDESKPVTVALNEEYEEAYRRYIIGRILAYGPDPDPTDMEFLVKRNLHGAACEWTGANPKTGYPYLAKMSNPENGFIMESPWRRSGRRILVFRKPEYYDMQTEEIVRLHPKQGLRFAPDKNGINSAGP